MKTIEINLYSYNELSDEAKQKAKDDFYYDDFWSSEREKSVREAQKLYDMLNTEEEIKGIRLYKFIQNNILPRLKNHIKYVKGGGKYPSSKIYKDEKARFSKIQFNEDAANLTGYCADYSFLEPIFDFLAKPDNTTSTELARTNLEHIYELEAQNDYESFFDEDNFADHCQANGYTFEENGEMRNH